MMQTRGTNTVDRTCHTAAPKFRRPPTTSRKPPVPLRGDVLNTAVSLPRADKIADHVATNARDAILALPRRVAEVATPDWLQKRNYGAVPSYLLERKEQIVMETAAAAAALTAVRPTNGKREVEIEERTALLTGLRRRRDATMTQYHLIDHKKTSSSTSTIGEIRSKERLEAMLTQLDSDIVRLSTVGPIYVVNDGESADNAARVRPSPPPPASAYECF